MEATLRGDIGQRRARKNGSFFALVKGIMCGMEQTIERQKSTLE